MERIALRRRAAILGGIALLALLLVGGLWAWRRLADPIAAALDGDSTAAAAVRAPEGVRIRVQVLNTTATRGLARRATLYLRDRGFDVVEMGTLGPARDQTTVLDRSGHPEWARRVAAALGGAQVESRPDSSRYLDVTVLLGREWRPPAEPLDP